MRSLADVIAFNEANREREMPFFGQDLFLQAERKGPLTEEAYIQARDRTRRLAGPDGIDRALEAYALDALIAPTVGPPWLTDLVIGDRIDGGSTSPAAAAGYPSITVPAGFAHGLPVGLSFIGAAWSEAALIRLAYAYEQATRHRRPPAFAPSARLDSSAGAIDAPDSAR